jgi:flagellar assembly protein FliH
VVLPYAWQRAGSVPTNLSASVAVSPVFAAEDGTPVAARDTQLATIERDAFAKAFAQGERAGAEAAAVQAEAMMRRLSQAIDDIASLRARVIRDTERQMVQLALTVARRIIHREVSLDRELVMAVARVALDRIGDAAQITIRLNADDHAAIAAARGEAWAGTQVRVVADARLPRGGCRIESELGSIDAGVDAQLQEMTQTLLQDAPVTINAHPR